MGTKKASQNSCTILAIRYYFEFTSSKGVNCVRFVPHKVVKHKVEPPAKEELASEKNDDAKVTYEDDVKYLRSLDPKEWKKQDHYRVLGIKGLRSEASEDVIKTAYRKMVLKHHPDKRKALGEEIRPDDDYFTCITMAYETLGTLNRRRAYDSVDPEFDNSLPSNSELKQDFFKMCSYYFDLNSRWSEKHPVPKLGDTNSSREEVDKFYSFWYDFKSWREYSYEDEEDKDKCADRDERRMCDKLNKIERQRKKKEEMLRIRNLVDLAYGIDPRIAKFKTEEKERKLAAKRAKQNAFQAKKEEEARIAKQAQIMREKMEAQERARIEAKRQEREQQKKALKKERKILRDNCKVNNYYSKSKDEELVNMQTVDKICEVFSLLELEDLNSKLKSNGSSAFEKVMREFESRVETERRETTTSSTEKSINGQNNDKNGLKVKPEWSQENIQLLIKAINLFPAGTAQRWEVVANFINQHGSFVENSSVFSSKEVLSKAKDLQKTDFSRNDIKAAANKDAYINFEKEKRAVKTVDESEISKKVVENTKPPQTNGFVELNNSVKEEDKKQDIPWTPIEQQLLEQALKTFSTTTPNRWDRIAECIPNRSKKDCMKRYKELAQIVKAKHAAQAAVNSK